MFKQRNKKNSSLIEGVLTGVLICTLLFFAFMLVATIILYLGGDPTYKSELWSFGAMLLSGAVAGPVNSRVREKNGVLLSVLSALMFVILLFLIATLTSGVPSLPTLVNYAVYVAVVAICAYLSLHKPKKHRRHR